MFNLKRNTVCLVMMLSALVLVPFPAVAGTVSVTREAQSVFKLTASGMKSPAGYDITLGFDAARLSNPRVALGSAAMGALLAANTNLPGTLHIAVIKPIAMSGDGAIATVSFDMAGDGPGAITVLKGKAIDAKAADLHASFYGWSPPDAVARNLEDPLVTPATTPAATSAPTTTVATPPTVAQAGGSRYLVGGTVTLPADDLKPVGGKEEPGRGQPPQQEGRTAAAPAKGGEAAAREVAPPSEKTASLPRPPQSVLEKFRLFTGEKTPAKLIALFNRDPHAPYPQSPAISLADDEAVLKVGIPSLPDGKVPLFILTLASYVGLEQADNGDLQVAVRPEKGALRASIKMLAGEFQQEIPLTVVPQADVDLDGSGTVTEADFMLFLKTSGRDGAPAFDLNRDGNRDYVDEYIFTANYLAKKGAQESKNVLMQQKGR